MFAAVAEFDEFFSRGPIEMCTATLISVVTSDPRQIKCTKTILWFGLLYIIVTTIKRFL